MPAADIHDIGSNQEGTDGFSVYGSPVDNGDYYTFDGSADGLYAGSDWGDESAIDVYAKIRVHDKAKGSAQVIWKSGGRNQGIAIGLDASGNIGIFGRVSGTLTSITIPPASFSNNVWYELYTSKTKIALKNISTGQVVDQSGSCSTGDGTGEESIGLSYAQCPIAFVLETASFFDGDIDLVEIWAEGELPFPSEGTTELQDASLDLGAYYQDLDDLSTFLRAHDGLEFRDLQALLAAFHLNKEDLATSLRASFESMTDLKAYLETWGTGYKDLGTFLDLKAQKIEDLQAFFKTGKAIFKDLAVFLSVTDGTVLRDLASFLFVTDGVVERDLGMCLRVISATPAFRTITAQRLASVIHEVS